MKNRNTHKTGDRVETVIETVAFGAEGVGRTEGLVIFVPYTAPGDRVLVRITAAKKNYLRGELLTVIAPSEFRVGPKCRRYGRCGGCHYQHIAYAHQLQMKKRQVADAFERIGGMQRIGIEDCLPSDAQYGYRGKAEFHGGYERNQKVLGFMAPRSNRLVDVDRCEIMEESINQAYGQYRERFLNGPAEQALEADPVFWSGCRYRESPDIARRVKGREFQVPYDGFFQANLALIDQMVETVLAHCDLTGTETVLDCFSGCGLFSLFAAERCRRVYGLEIDAEAVRCANRNSEAFGCSNAGFLAGRAEDLSIIAAREEIRPDLIILDPPRTGCGPEVIRAVIELAPERLVYVSCDPATQARDIGRLTEYGYLPCRVQPVDMFPQTKHIEVVASLRKNERG